MPIIRSCEDLTSVSLDAPLNASFVLNTENSNQTGTRPKTRSMSKQNKVQENNRLLTDESTRPPNAGQINESQVRQIVSDTLQGFRNEITTSISTEIGDLFSRLEMNSHASAQHTSNVVNGYSNNSSNGPIGASENSEKVMNIMRNWRLTFTRSSNGMAIREFIYRVNIMTTNTLRGNFDLMCKYVHLLFDGKALQWFWRYHRQNDSIEWVQLSSSLKREYKDFDSDFDIKEDIRRRRQRFNESFEEFHDAILVLTDKLSSPMSDEELCETMIRNLKSEIRHELLHLDISHVADLRKAVRKHEKFMREFHGGNKNRNLREKAQVAQIEEGSFVDTDDMDDGDACELLKVTKCWNCDEEGHSYKDCSEEKKVFCYGCGRKNTYRPNCPNCHLQGNSATDVPRQKRGHPRPHLRN